MKKAKPTFNKINFILLVNLLAFIDLVNISAISLNNGLDSLDARIDKVVREMRSYNDNYPTVHLIEFSDFSY